VVETAKRRLGLPGRLPDVAHSTLLMPIRLGGFGLRPVSLVSPAAFYSAAAQAAQDIYGFIPEAKRRSLLGEGPTQLRFASRVGDALKQLHAAGLEGGADAILPANLEAFWTRFSRDGPERKLQRALCGLMESRARSTLMGSLSLKRDTQRLESLAGRNAGAWLTCYPSCSELSLSDSQFCLASRLRLGLPPYDDLPVDCSCEEAKLGDDPAHYLSCSKLRGSAVTDRHNMLVRLLAKLFRATAGASVRITPKLFDSKRLIPDMQVIRPEGDLFIDVVVSHPSAPSRSSKRPLAATSNAEALKHRRYGEAVEARGGDLLAFGVDSFGAFGKEAMKVVEKLRDGAVGSIFKSLPTTSSPSFAVSALAVCLQKGNAQVFKKGSLDSRLVAAKWGGLQISDETASNFA
jgi:hypothetical protein